jgi:hypothetical protein
MQSPFKFLSAYEKEDRNVFFGRDEEIALLYDLTFRSSLMLIYGLSGTGKTSLIRCGLASELKDSDWLPIFVRRRQDLNASLRAELERVSITPFLDYNGDGRISITEAVSSLYLDFFKPIYLIFDQFEELFILGTAEEQKEFINEMSELLDNQQNCKVLICMREEYIGALYDFEREVPELLNKRLRLEPMNQANLQTVIGRTTQALEIGIETPQQTIQQILQNIGGKKTGSVSLPYLQVYLDKLYRTAYQPEKQVVFTEKLVAETGEIQDVLDDFLANQIKEIDEKWGKNDLSRRLLNEFLTTEGTKRPCEIAELNERCKELLPPAELQNLLLELVNRRILQSEENRYELAHDSLAAAIDRRRTAEERALLDISRMVKEGLTAFQKTGGLLSAENLKYVQPFEGKIPLSEAEKDFLAKSKAKVRANRRQRQVAITFLIMLTVFAVGFGFWAYQAEQKANEALETVKEEQAKTQKALDDFVEAEKQRKKAEAQSLLNTANQLINVGSQDAYQEALGYLEKAIQIDSTNQEIRERIQFCKEKMK